MGATTPGWGVPANMPGTTQRKPLGPRDSLTITRPTELASSTP